MATVYAPPPPTRTLFWHHCCLPFPSLRVCSHPAVAVNCIFPLKKGKLFFGQLNYATVFLCRLCQSLSRLMPLMTSVMKEISMKNVLYGVRKISFLTQVFEPCEGGITVLILWVTPPVWFAFRVCTATGRPKQPRRGCRRESFLIRKSGQNTMSAFLPTQVGSQYTHLHLYILFTVCWQSIGPLSDDHQGKVHADLTLGHPIRWMMVRGSSKGDRWIKLQRCVIGR